MGILSWDKPTQVMSKEKWASISADGAPPGVYVPNMSRADQEKWKAKIIGGQYPRVEIRKTASSQMVIVVSLTGDPMYHNKWAKKDYGQETNIKVSMNGPAEMTFEEFDEFHQAILEAKSALEAAR